MGCAARFQAVFFDLDDTLIDRAAAFSRWLAERRRRSSSGASPSRASNHDRLVALDAGGHSDRMVLCEAIVRELALAATPGQLFEEMQAELPACFAPEPASARLLAELKARHRVTIVTNGSGRVQRAKLARTGLDAHAADVLVAGEIGVAKPSPGIFARALAWAACPPEGALFVGDHPELDIAGASAVGMHTAWIRRGRAWPLGLPAPNWTLDSVHAVHEVLA